MSPSGIPEFNKNAIEEWSVETFVQLVTATISGRVVSIMSSVEIDGWKREVISPLNLEDFWSAAGITKITFDDIITYVAENKWIQQWWESELGAIMVAFCIRVQLEKNMKIDPTNFAFLEPKITPLSDPNTEKEWGELMQAAA